jgi:hypothetical protein
MALSGEPLLCNCPYNYASQLEPAPQGHKRGGSFGRGVKKL